MITPLQIAIILIVFFIFGFLSCWAFFRTTIYLTLYKKLSDEIETKYRTITQEAINGMKDETTKFIENVSTQRDTLIDASKNAINQSKFFKAENEAYITFILMLNAGNPQYIEHACSMSSDKNQPIIRKLLNQEN